MTGVLAGQRILSARENDNSARTLAYTAIVANSASSASTTEVVAITTPTILFRSARAFRLSIKGRMALTATGDEGQIGVRKTNSTTNPKLFDSFRFGGGPAGTYGYFFQNIVINTSGSDVSVPLVMTYFRVTGTSVAISASTADPSYLMVEDIGPASDYPSATSLT
ncbi:hypothetical protein [Streptomyces sp. CA-111067]|uniref:hypothetical protein n=1 Tax=Streptomyces sp. CA-111067 TaxID=3240046 RepID=UPI003D968212